MKNNNTDLVDKHLESLNGMREATTDPFFYTRLRSKMEQRNAQPELKWRPAFVISVLLVFLFINVWMIDQQKNNREQNNTSSLQSFARTYDLTVSDYY
jgi:hypothetical protein